MYTPYKDPSMVKMRRTGDLRVHSTYNTTLLLTVRENHSRDAEKIEGTRSSRVLLQNSGFQTGEQRLTFKLQYYICLNRTLKMTDSTMQMVEMP